MSTRKVSNKQIRDIQRATHLVAALILVLSVYTPLGSVSLFSTFMQFLVLPVLAVTGSTEANDTQERIHIMSTTILINPFEVPQGQEEAFIKGWREAAEHMRHAPGFLSTRLHESLDPQAKFRFVNVAEWESPQHFQAAMSSAGFQQITQKRPFAAFPALYRIIVEE